jgi:hypothetical protein
MEYLKLHHIKFYVICFIIVQLATLKTQAQFFMAGPKAGIQIYGVNYELQSAKEQFDSKIKVGYTAGFQFNIPLTGSFNLNPEINYTQRGRKVYAKEAGWTFDEVHHFIELPIILNFQREGRIKKLGTFTWFLGMGPNISYFLGGSGTLQTNVGGSLDYNFSFEGKEGDYAYMTLDSINKWQWGLDVNIGLISPLKNNKSLITTLRFTWGHTAFGEENSSSMPILGFTDNLKHSYNILNLSFAYLFNVDLGLFRKGKSTKGAKIKTKNVGGKKNGKPQNINRIKKNKN